MHDFLVPGPVFVLNGGGQQRSRLRTSDLHRRRMVCASDSGSLESQIHLIIYNCSAQNDQWKSDGSSLSAIICVILLDQSYGSLIIYNFILCRCFKLLIYS